ncbi:MAG: EamA/RhaT family transporter [Desulfobacteraceae bacterium]|nr:MAG: EamA/RhaT family transporter [Desulfobacteraceae bacterium]
MADLNKSSGIIAMAATAFLWSIAGLFIKIIDWNPFAIAGMRSFIASIVVFIYLKRPEIHLSFPQIAAAIANAATMLLFVSANKMTTAANAILLQYFAPVLTVFIGAVLLKERTRMEHFISLPIVTAGMILMFFDELGGGKLFGNILAVMSAITFSLYFIFMRMQKDGSPLESILISHWITAGICLIFSFFLPAPHITSKSLAAIAVLGIVQVGLSSILFSVAIKRVSAVQANLIAVIEPVFNPLWVFFVIGEAPGINTLIGGSIIIIAVTMASIVSARRREEVVFTGDLLKYDAAELAKFNKK